MHDFEAEAEAAFEAEMARELADPDCPIEAESWAYQEMVKRGYVEGYIQGVMTELRLKALVPILEHFPHQAREAQQNLELIQDPEVLQNLIGAFYKAQTAEEIMHMISEAVSKM